LNKVIVKPGDGFLEVSMPDIAVKTRALRVLVELGDVVVELTQAGNSVRLKTPRGEYYLKNVKVGVKDVFSVEERSPTIIIHSAVYVY
jgi:hypothetical protein